MAEVYVNSWEEFVTAVGVAGDTVILPEEATWNMNEIAPLGVSDIIYIRCAVIEGRGTRIKNLNITGYFSIANNVTFNDFFLTDFICSGTRGQLFWLQGSSKTVNFNGCAFSGILSAAAKGFVASSSGEACSANFTQSSVNVECAGANFVLTAGLSDHNLKYCRIEIHAPNSTYDGHIGSGSKTCDFCEMVLYIPKAPRFRTFSFRGCTVRGNMQIATEYSDSSSGTWKGNVSVYSTDAFGDGFTPYKPQFFVGVSEEQLKDPAYLRSFGFPIVVV